MPLRKNYNNRICYFTSFFTVVLVSFLLLKKADPLEAFQITSTNSINIHLRSSTRTTTNSSIHKRIYKTTTTYNDTFQTKLMLGRNRIDDENVEPLQPSLSSSSSSSSSSPSTTSSLSPKNNPIIPLIGFTTISIAYWYLLVFGAAANANGLPVPSFIPMVPGWPPSDADLVPVVEDSIHFFYISDVLEYISSMSMTTAGESQESVSAITAATATTTTIPPLRLAFFNFAEAWVFCFLPFMIEDRKRLPLPVVLFTWFGALGLTNAFLAPYLAMRQLFVVLQEDEDDEVKKEKEEISSSSSSFKCPKVIKILFGTTASLVIGNALTQTMITSFFGTTDGWKEWNDFFQLVVSDRTYLAFAVDLVLFSIFQLFLLNDVIEGNGSNYDHDDDNNGTTIRNNDINKNKNIPVASMLWWLFKS